MNSSQRTLLCLILASSLLAPQLLAQDTTGFIDPLTRGTGNPSIAWSESWFDGFSYNLSFTDNFFFTYRYYGDSPDIDTALIAKGAFDATMGNFSTFNPGPRFLLLGYVEEDEIWCILPAVLSPEYIHHFARADGIEYWVDEIWCTWREFWFHHLPEYLYEETYVDHSFTIWARLPSNRHVQVWWGADAFARWDSYRHGDLITARDIWVSPPNDFEPQVRYDDWGDYMASGSGLWCLLDTFFVEGPEPPPGFEPPGWAECTFKDWVYPSGASAKDWLPEPNSIVGLKFKFHRQDVPARAIVRFNIYNISTWQGECMNYPVDAPIPRATGTGEFFDFTVVDSGQYDDIDTLDFDLYGGMQLDFIPGNASEIASVRRYILTLNLDFPAGTHDIFHTLWLKTHDYGAKAIVSPGTGQTWRDLMTLRETAFGQHVWSVSVPRDDDGQAFQGYNWGDFMADAWEEQKLGLPSKSSDSAIVRFTPFYNNETGSLFYADRDSIPEGRSIKGDGFCNWEEYRGFMTVGDQYRFYSTKLHKRLNPFRKEVMVHFMPNAESRPYAPGWMNALPDTMAYLVDHLTELVDTDSFRLDLMRWVNINRLGAYYPYYSSRSYWDDEMGFETTNQPADLEGQNAVVFWSIYRGNNIDLRPPRNGQIFGYVKRYVYFPGGGTIPRHAFQVVVNTEWIDVYTANVPYYRNHFDDYLADIAKMKRLTIAHEGGHTIGMPHDSPLLFKKYIMANSPIADGNNQFKWVLDPPEFTRQYSDSSKFKISILMEER